MKELMVLFLVVGSFIVGWSQPYGEGYIWGWGPAGIGNTWVDRDTFVFLDP